MLVEAVNRCSDRSSFINWEMDRREKDHDIDSQEASQARDALGLNSQSLHGVTYKLRS